ncbi:Bifunctional inhibitor/lipid-transfer protein/seed storage 2S albumin superfamily protein [Euphorbia peplus]|nr:Bifunctional inhibitor/lipid-transfer protein/seed storage 2S albumin superfamily protein [Euphorbia peplus]
MEISKVIKLFTIISAILLVSVNGQISTPCTSSLISSFTPCINFITGSSNNGTSPTRSCCNALASVMSTSTDCACLLITANVPVQLPINRTLALSLPRACRMSGVPLQCKASGTPLPAPGPVLLGPTLPPPAASPLSPRASKAVAVAPAPELGTTLEPASPPELTGGSRPVLNPSASVPPLSSPPMSLLLFIASMVFKFY